MIVIKPELQVKYPCPECQGKLEAKDFHLTGMRSFYDCTCLRCKRQFFADIPAGHALFYPVVIEKNSKKVFAFKKASWFSNLFIKMLEEEKTSFPLEVIKKGNYEKIVVLNCLDYLYGHSIFKLFNATRNIFKGDGTRGRLVIIPENIRHLLPKDIEEVWIVKSKAKETILWNQQLDRKFHNFINNKKEVSFLDAFPAAPLYREFNLFDYVKLDKNFVSGYKRPTVLYAYRSDRLWGKSLYDQRDRIIKLGELLIKSLPNCDFVVGSGFKDEISFPKPIIDRRFTKSSFESETELVNLLSKIDVVIGVHGSHMILPSALAGSIVDLLPSKKFGNYAQDYMLNPQFSGIHENIYRFLTIRGNDDLTNVSPITVAQTVTDYQTNILWRTKEVEFGQDLKEMDPWTTSLIWRRINNNF